MKQFTEHQFDYWSSYYEEFLTGYFAETGADRELDFNRETEELRLFDLYQKNKGVVHGFEVHHLESQKENEETLA